MTMKRAVLGTLIILVAAALCIAAGSSEESLRLGVDGAGLPANIRIEAGEHFTHKMKIMPLVHVKNAPQMVIWAETTEGEFVETIFVTNRTATQSWRSAPADATPQDEIRRDEALPVWSHRRGAEELPAAEMREGGDDVTAPDAVTAATPKRSFEIVTTLPEGSKDIVLYLEVNNSADFNDAYPADARPGSERYSGGEWGSGQPSLVYAAPLRGGAGRGRSSFEIIGHGCPDGSNGGVSPDLGGVTTARSILAGAEVRCWGEG